MSRGILNSQKMKSNFAVIQRAIRRALPRDELDKKYIVEAGLKEANTMLSAFRTEERRVSEKHTSITSGDARHKLLASPLLHIVLCYVCVIKTLSSVTNYRRSVGAGCGSITN